MFRTDKKLKDLCTFGIGGTARYFTEVQTIDQMQKTLEACRKQGLPYLIIGKGSNCLFDDRGFDGVVILNKIDFINRPAAHIFHVGAGYSFSLLGTQTARQGLGGLEFASGIPGTVGGAVFMNAGANGTETCQSLDAVDFIAEDGSLHSLKKTDLNFSYRSSSFQTMRGVIAGATFILSPSESARTRQLEIIEYRKKTQPLKDKSAGCIFRNPHCGHAGALIEKSGLKGKCVGGAKVSEIHANFIVNIGGATAQDVLALIDLIKHEVKEKMGVELESEVRHIK